MYNVLFRRPLNYNWVLFADCIFTEQRAVRDSKTLFLYNPTYVVVVTNEDGFIILTLKSETELHDWMKEGF